jgi:2-polyprenyl-3-methyl-5-hydroxy-6-metoxy-1,4-benzoquinol methylase
VSTGKFAAKGKLKSGSGAAYDFHRCKLCGKPTAAPLYDLTVTTVYGCSDCDFHFIDFLDDLSPRGDENSEKIDQKSWDYIETRLTGNALRSARRLNLIGQHASVLQAACLDIGAGAGDFAALLASEGATVCGVEPSHIRRKFAHRHFGLDLRGEPVEELCEKEDFAERFDMAILWDVIEHVNFPAETLAAAARTLKPGGLLFLDTPSRDALSYRLSESAYRLSAGKAPLFLGAFYSPHPFAHKQIFRPQQIARLARRCGFDVVSLQCGYEPGGGFFSFLRPRNTIVLVCRRSR